MTLSSRRERFQQKQFTKKLILYVVLLIVFVVALFFFGMRIIIDLSLRLTGGTPQVEQAATPDAFFGSVEVTDIPVATNSAQFILTGTIAEYDMFEIYVNDAVVAKKDVPVDEVFREEVGELTPGENTVFVRARTADKKHTKDTDTYTIVYKQDKPTLETSEPQENVRVFRSQLTVSGKTDPGILVKINGFPVVVDSQGTFSTTVTLQQGDNTVAVSARDDAGNEEKKELKVTYQQD